MVWPVQTHPAQSTGPESKRNSGDGGYFSLDFSFYRTALPKKRTEGPNCAGRSTCPVYIHSSPTSRRRRYDETQSRAVRR